MIFFVLTLVTGVRNYVVIMIFLIAGAKGVISFQRKRVSWAIFAFVTSMFLRKHEVFVLVTFVAVQIVVNVVYL